ncbi:MAG: B12-binding domain-containing radical SAM protein, partial [Candidatus Omnitrophica bacterium]|nr:B12-binding domain-containing radical SAM protein [Candidatus Omnitrophota bacterium]
FGKTVAVPYGLLSIATVLKKAGHNILIYDENVQDYTLERLMSFNPAAVGLSVLTGPSIQRAIELSKRIKEKAAEVTVIWGGVHPSLLPDETIREDYIDYIVMGEGERTVLNLLRHIQNPSQFPIEHVEGVCYKRGGNAIKQPRREFIQDLDELPDPDWGLIEVEKYIRLDKQSNLRRINLCSSRGCPYDCSFCYNRAFNRDRKFASFSAERIAGWIKYLKERHGIGYFKFWEDNFTVDKQRLRDFCRTLTQREFDIKWACESRVDIKEEEFRMMKESGCDEIGFGVESGSPRILDFINKRIRLEDVEYACNKCLEVGTKSRLYFMVGIPTETIEDFEMTLSLTKRLPHFGLEYMFYRPYPGTRLYQYSVDKGLFRPPESLEKWAQCSELYSVDYNLSEIPTEMIKREMRRFKRDYALHQALYVLKYEKAHMAKFLLSPKSLAKNIKTIINQVLRNL